MKEAGADTICFEYEHGDAEHKKELEKLLAATVPGDTILTMEVSRLARSTKQLCGLIDMVKEKRLRLEILGSITVDCTAGELDPMTKAFLQMSGVFAELELSMTRARVKSGMADGTEKDKIFSYNTYKSYWKHTKYFIKYIKEKHPGCTTLKSAKKYVNEWLQARADQGLSAWTVQLEAKALGKLYGIQPDDENYFTPPSGTGRISNGVAGTGCATGISPKPIMTS